MGYATHRITYRPKELMADLKGLICPVSWQTINVDRGSLLSKLDALPSVAGYADRAMLPPIFEEAINEYERLREAPELWQRCCGKQVLADVAKQLRFSNASPIERRLQKAWSENRETEPDAITALRAHLLEERKTQAPAATA